MGQPVTTNPLLIMFINMAVVFAVLYGLSLIIRLIQKIDPTQKKSVVKSEPAPAVAPVAAVAAAPAEPDQNQLIAVLAAAVAATGFGAARILAVRPVGGKGWAQAARLETVQNRSKMY
ncbi:MAG: OadG family protein [Sporomusaceae bacterium]|nr:OadG family protein [Sporomusaceae bacterium]